VPLPLLAWTIKLPIPITFSTATPLSFSTTAILPPPECLLCLPLPLSGCAALLFPPSLCFPSLSGQCSQIDNRRRPLPDRAIDEQEMEDVKPAEAKSSRPAAESTRRQWNRGGISMHIRQQDVTLPLRRPWTAPTLK
jgi:hypothetical protein